MSGSADFLLELLSEEIPARMQARARNDLAKMLAEELDDAGLQHEGIVTYSTPRRLALIARRIPLESPSVRIETKGPRVGAPEQALSGFLQKFGLQKEQLIERGGVYFAERLAAGRPTSNILAFAVERIVQKFPWPKSMRWGDASASTASLRWVRPLHSIVALLGNEIVPVAIEGVSCGAATLGHRFHHPGPITIGGAHDYVEKLRACHVLVDQAEREAIIRARAAELADDAGYVLVADEGLVVENAGLTEWPVPLLGSFDPDFLDVPEEVVQLTARINQKYFVARDPMTGKLAPHFVCTANIDANDGGTAIVAGNERVLAARLSDARFFWQQDVKVPLEAQAQKLGQIVFHEKLGTVADKVERVARLARWLVEEGIVAGANPDDAERAARLAKADLVTGMVGEFPELQGVIGGYLAAAQGEPKVVSDAIRDHYKPVGQGDDVPTAPVTVAVSLADKLDTFIAYFAVGEIPTGSKDPYAIRRATLSLLTLMTHNRIRLPWLSLLEQSLNEVSFSCGKAAGFKQFAEYGHYLRALDWRPNEAMAVLQGHYNDGPESRDYAEKRFGELSKTFSDAPSKIGNFLQERLKVQQRESGVRHDLIDAVFALGGEDDLVRLLARVTALQAFVETGEGRDLHAGYKRAANILKKEPLTPLADGESPSPARGEGVPVEEVTLVEAIETAEPAVAASIDAEDFTGAMAALASLRAPIDACFEGVIVNDPDPAIRARRLGLLARFRDAVHRVADFSKIEG